MPSSSVRVVGKAGAASRPRASGVAVAAGCERAGRVGGMVGVAASRRCVQAASATAMAATAATRRPRRAAERRADGERKRTRQGTPELEGGARGPRQTEPLASDVKEGSSAGRSHRCLPFLSKVEHRPRGRRPDLRTLAIDGGHRSGTVPELHRLRDPRRRSLWPERSTVVSRARGPCQLAAESADKCQIRGVCDHRRPRPPPAQPRPPEEVRQVSRVRWWRRLVPPLLRRAPDRRGARSPSGRPTRPRSTSNERPSTRHAMATRTRSSRR